MLFLRYFHTIRFLKFRQIFYRIKKKFASGGIPSRPAPEVADSPKGFSGLVFREPSMIGPGVYIFLNRRAELQEVGWDEKFTPPDTVAKLPLLWRYNLHYFDDLTAVGSECRREWHRELLDNWRLENPVGVGVGWDPYPTSLRIVNWIKWHWSGCDLGFNNLESLATQLRWLANRLEWHLLGNHLVANAKALIFGGIFFEGDEADRWLNLGLQIFNAEVEEQILPDGGNFELSPMYHSIFLCDLLELIRLALSKPAQMHTAQLDTWKCKASGMLAWLIAMTHPDRGIAFFNDSAFGIAAPSEILNQYAIDVGVVPSYSNGSPATYLSDSGYVRATHGKATVICDVGRIGPDYLPGHAHADTLSFELSINANRILVNTGTSGYQIGKTREYERGTSAHNTVKVDDLDSSEVWSSFRVARRASPRHVSVDSDAAHTTISAAHDGYMRLASRALHHRVWRLTPENLLIEDIVTRQRYTDKDTEYAYFHFHPSVTLKNDDDKTWCAIMANGDRVSIRIEKGLAQQIDSYYAPEFGLQVRTSCLRISLVNHESRVRISWS